MGCSRVVGAFWVLMMYILPAAGAQPNVAGGATLGCLPELLPLLQDERWPDVERRARELMARLQARLGPDAPDVARAEIAKGLHPNLPGYWIDCLSRGDRPGDHVAASSMAGLSASNLKLKVPPATTEFGSAK